MFFILYFILEKNQLLLYNYDNNGMVIAMKKNGFIISTTLYGIFGIMMITVFYILYILGANRTVVSTSTAQAKKGIETYKYDKIYVNFLGSSSDLNSKVSNSSIDELVKKLESKNIYMEYDKRLTSTKSINTTNNNAPYEQNIIANKIFEYTSDETDDLTYSCGSNAPNGVSLLGVTNNGNIIFMETYKYADKSVNVTYTIIDIKKNREKRFTVQSVNEVSFSSITKINSYFNQDSNDSLEICLQLQKDNSYNSKIITFNYDTLTYSVDSFRKSRCSSSYSSLEDYKEDTTITPIEIGGYSTNSNSIKINCNYEICFNEIDDLDHDFYDPKLKGTARFNSNESLFVYNSNVKRYGDVIAVRKPYERKEGSRIFSKCDMEAYMVWYPPKYSTITTNVKVFNLTNSNKDPNTQYQKQYYVFVSQDNKDALGISRIEFNDTLNNTLNKAINTRSLLFSDNPSVFPVTNNVSTYSYNSNVLNELENQIINDLG